MVNNEIINQLTMEEKVTLLTGAASMRTADITRFGISGKQMADGPHGVRTDRKKNATHFPNLCSLAATWNVEAAEKMGEALAEDCRHLGIDMLLGPGINIKRNILCGRNFEYLSEDPVLAGELGAGYINGLQKNGVAASLKHFALNSQETNRTLLNVEIDERTMREIYLKAFEIAVKKSKPESVMCAYNKIGGLWCSENPLLLTEVLREDWGYEGFVVSDWGAVHDIVRAVKAGLDLQMPRNPKTPQILMEAVERGEISEQEIDQAAARVLNLLLKTENKNCNVDKIYDRERQHQTARELAAEGIVLLKNQDNALPLKDVRKIAVFGEFAVKPLIAGQGSAEVLNAPEYAENPLEELRKALPGIEIKYMECYGNRAFSEEMLWPKLNEPEAFASDCDVVLFFAGSMVSEDTECFDRRSAYLNENYEMIIDFIAGQGKKVVVVLQSGGALILGKWKDKVSAIVQMWLGGEGAGGAIADVLTGKVNPSGKLPETFPNRMRKDLEICRGLIDTYSEKLEVGYRYYDKHPEEICYPFGHGLSYTEFVYSDLKLEPGDEKVRVSFRLTNTGNCVGREVVQIYVSARNSVVTRTEKELKAFRKIRLEAGESVCVTFELEKEDFAYYNTMLHQWVAEAGNYEILVGASSRDIRLSEEFQAKWQSPYSVQKMSEDMIG